MASSYTKVGGLYDGGFRHDPKRPLETLAEYCLGCYTNLGLPTRLALLERYIREYRADGFMINSIKSCNSFSVGQLLMLRQLEQRTGVPGGFIESDLVDPRYFSAANIKNRIESYLQMLEQKRAGVSCMSTLRTYVGIDLGSTTTKAVVLNDAGEVIGRGITNSRSNYDVACQVVREEALVRTRFTLTRQAIGGDPAWLRSRRRSFRRLERNFRFRQHLDQLARLREALLRAAADPRHSAHRTAVKQRRRKHCGRDGRASRRATSANWRCARATSSATSPPPITCKWRNSTAIPAESPSTCCAACSTPRSWWWRTRTPAAASQPNCEARWGPRWRRPTPAVQQQASRLRAVVEASCDTEIVEAGTVGTGYGRQRLPFPKEQIRSEILCHGLGAHAMFPATRTVLDIGGQDTKAIQVDGDGIVVSFQMNDRCAAGCGRYLGYIADEMNLGLHELGPLAEQSQSRVRINSTCTVFASAELRERLSLGQRREDILGGLHRAIILRAMSLLARSGGVADEFTFTGGVARNTAAVDALRELVRENYGERTLNISADSIYTGALGAALFARRTAQADA